MKFSFRPYRTENLGFTTKAARIFLFISTLIFASTPASSQTPCESIDALLQTVSTVRRVEIEVGDERRFENLSNLEDQLEGLSLVTLFPSLDENVFLSEQEDVQQYLSAMQKVVGAEKNNLSPKVRTTIGEAVTPEFVASLASLDSYWGCNFVATHSDQTVSKPRNISTQFGREPVRAEDQLEGVYSPIPKLSNHPTRAESHASVSHVTLKPLLLEGGKGVLLLIIFIIVSSVSAYLYFKYQALQSIREARHLLYLPVISKINEVNHPMVLVDISMNGGKLKHDRVIQGKPHIRFFVGKRWLTGQVRWSNSSHAGVLFKSPLDADVLMDVVQEKNVD